VVRSGQTGGVTENLELNGEPLELSDQGLLRATTYGHFTSMQLRDGRVRGLGLHLERLDRSSLADLATYTAAYLTNSIDPALPVASITTATGITTYAPDPTSLNLITKAYEAVPPQPI
jgi:branched-subunit amino acid aminotransferase/4-amino-4-deoxychorismate lyase